MDSPAYMEHMREVRLREDEAGLRKDCPTDDHCPALMAESVVTTTEHLIVECAAEMLKKDITIHKLLCAGLDKYKRFIDLCVGAVVNLPDFRNPLAVTP